MFSEETLYSIALRHCPLIGDTIFRRLVTEAGSAKEVWELSKSGLSNVYRVGKRISQEIGKPEHLVFAEKEVAFCEKNKIRILLRHQGELPPQLNECEDAPAILYQKGEWKTTLQTLSIVGTRNITSYGKSFINDFLNEIKDHRVITVSGLALGVDTEVHEVSLNNGLPTIAVLAHGFHTLYPSKNRRLAEKILDNGGALFTEFNSSQKPDRENFIQRNRIIAGLSAATIVVETAFGGGSMSTATFANNYNREVFALPGRITDKFSQGCNQLIVQNKAAAISTVTLLADQLGFSKSATVGVLFPSSEVQIMLPENQQQLLAVLDRQAALSLDEICLKLDLPTYRVLPDLLQLELLGYVKALSGRQYLAL